MSLCLFEIVFFEVISCFSIKTWADLSSFNIWITCPLLFLTSSLFILGWSILDVCIRKLQLTFSSYFIGNLINSFLFFQLIFCYFVVHFLSIHAIWSLPEFIAVHYFIYSSFLDLTTVVLIIIIDSFLLDHLFKVLSFRWLLRMPGLSQ